MKIMIDCRLASSSSRGMARYCREIVRCLLELNHTDDFFLLIFYKDSFFSKKMPENFHLILVNSKNYIVSEQIDIPRIVNKIRPDILWCTSNTYPLLLRKNTKLIVTIHDLIFLDKLPGKSTLYKKIGQIYRSFVLKKSSKCIDEYFTVSNYSNIQIQTKLKITSRNLITPNCLSEDFINLAQKYIKEKKDNYFFTVSGDSPSKNLPFLLDIFKNDLTNEKLYIAGLSRNSYLREMHSENIIFLDADIPDDEIIKKYSSCKAFIFPSLQEGFGIPIIEALCCHAKVIASDASCIPEILGKNGILFNPNDKNSFLEALKEMERTTFCYNYDKYKSWIHVSQLINNEFYKILGENNR